MIIRLAHTKTNVFLLELLVFLIISFIYVYIIKDVYGYMGFASDVEGMRVFVGFLFFIPMLFLGTQIRDEFFYTIWHIVFILFFFGQVIFYQYTEGSINPVIANAILLTVLFFASYVKVNFKIYRFKGKLLNIILLVSILLFTPIFIKYLPYVDYRNLLLENIYSTRFYFREFNDPYIGYIRGPLSRVVLPALMIIAIVKRKVWLAMLSAAMIMFIFLVGALKSIFIGMIAAIFFYWGKRFIDKVFLLLYLFFGLTFFGLIVFLINENTFLVNSFVRRILFTPALIDNDFYRLFEVRPLLWSHNAIGSLFFEYPLDRAPNMYVGEVVMNKPGLSANVGLVTEGFFSAHFLGVFLHSLFIGTFFIVLRQINIKPVFFGMVFAYIYYMNTSFLTVLLLTHGLFFFLVFAYFFLNKDYG